MPSPRRVIESHARPILKVAVDTGCRCVGGGEGLESHESRLQVALFVTDELLAHHREAAFSYMMLSLFTDHRCAARF